MKNADQTKDHESSINILETYSREAKRLHRAALHQQKHYALPVLRRLLNNNVLTDISLVELFERQQLVQRKHLFQLLAIETGYPNWAELKQQLQVATEVESHHYSMRLKGTGYPNLWFSNFEQAQQYAKENGGEPIKVGTQAVVAINE